MQFKNRKCNIQPVYWSVYAVCSLWGGKGLLQELLNLVRVGFELFVVDEEGRLRAWSHILQQVRRPATVSAFILKNTLLHRPL